MSKFKINQIIAWTFDNTDNYADIFKGKTFVAEIAMINEETKCYGVYAEYGQDLIPFDNAKNPTELLLDSIPESYNIREKAIEMDEKDFDLWWWETIYRNKKYKTVSK